MIWINIEPVLKMTQIQIETIYSKLVDANSVIIPGL